MRSVIPRAEPRSETEPSPRAFAIGGRAARAPLIIAVGGLIAIAGALLPWEYVSSAAGTRVRGGIETSDALVPIILGTVLLAAAIVVRRRGVSSYWRGMLLMCAAPILGVAVFDTIELTRAVAAFNAANQGVTASVGIGLYAIGVAGVVAVFGILRLPGAGRKPGDAWSGRAAGPATRSRQ